MTYLGSGYQLLPQLRLLQAQQPQLLSQGSALFLALLQQRLALLLRLPAQCCQPIPEVLLQLPEQSQQGQWQLYHHYVKYETGRGDL